MSETKRYDSINNVGESVENSTRVKELVEELEKMRIIVQELEETNQHLIRATFRERDLRKELAQTLEELQETKKIVDHQNKRIIESINYARKIQLAINATESSLAEEGFEKNFIFYRPKDVISGDFPWFYSRDKFLYLAAVDCTGHGVPGAMMSMIGNLLLNDITNDPMLLMPGSVLDFLHMAVVNTLKQADPDSDSSDGMDVAMVRIDIESKELVFSGAHRPLYYFKKSGEMIEFKGDRFPIGGTQYDKKRTEFEDYTIEYEEGDSFFIFSDGLPDQIGDPDGKKFYIDWVEEQLQAHHDKDMSEIKKIMESEFDKKKGDHKQVDDILMIGMRF